MGSSSSTSASTVAEVCEAYATSLCTLFERCVPYTLTYAFGEVTTCFASLKDTCSSSFGAVGSGFTVDSFRACADGFGVISCDDYASYRYPPECVPRGTLPDGSDCTASSQCAGGQCRVDTMGCGVCAVPVAAGGNCTSSTECTAGHVCASGTCQPFGVEGDTCGVRPCAFTFWCNQMGRCERHAALGAACGSSTVGACDTVQAQWCDTSTSTCVEMTLVGEGERCGPVGSTYALCSDGSYCAFNASPSTCKPRVALGAPCPSVDACAYPSVCVNGTCKAFGASCSD